MRARIFINFLLTVMAVVVSVYNGQENIELLVDIHVLYIGIRDLFINEGNSNNNNNRIALKK